VTDEGGCVEMKINYRKLFLLGFGFMGISIIWALYNADIPVILQEQFKMSNFATGWIMNIDNIFAITLIPIIAAYSDKVSTRIGRRMPFIITGMPLMAVFFAIIPWIPIWFGTSSTALILFMIVVILMNISAAISRGPVIALMPDIVPPEQRSPGNGVINFMGGLGSLLVYFGIGRSSSSNRPLGFAIAAIITLVAAFVVFRAINEPKDAIYYKPEHDQSHWWKSIGSLLNRNYKDLCLM
jgi:MFS family permease